MAVADVCWRLPLLRAVFLSLFIRFYVAVAEETVSKITVACPHCSRKYRVAPEVTGKTTKCAKCGERFKLVELVESVETAESPQAPATGDSSAASEVDDAQSDGQPFDPVTPYRSPNLATEQSLPAEPPPVAYDPHPPEKVDWKKSVKEKKKNVPFGGFAKILLAVGGLLALLGVVMNLLPLFGTQLARFQDNGSLGQFVGLIVGLVGAGIIGLGLRRFKMASMISGLTTAAFVFIVFGVSVFASGKRDKEKENDSAGAQSLPAASPHLDLMASPWTEEFPKWVGFDDGNIVPSATERWSRHALSGGAVSASFPGEPNPREGKFRVDRQQVSTRELWIELDGMEMNLTVFNFPKKGNKTDIACLAKVEAALGELEKSQKIELDGLSGRTYQKIEGAKSTHGNFFINGNVVSHVSLKGPTKSVPGTTSYEFLASLRPKGGDGESSGGLPEFELTGDLKTQNDAMATSIRELEALMDEYIHPRCRMNFSAKYLSRSAGPDTGNRRYLVHPAKVPVIGIDVIVANSNRGKLIAGIMPVYEKDKAGPNTVMAPDGYSLAAVNVNAGQYVKGVQFVFMEITPIGFDTSSIKMSDWLGTRASRKPDKIGGDGKPVYGIWLCGTKGIKAIGLIREKR